MNGKPVTRQLSLLLGIVIIAVVAIVLSNRTPEPTEPESGGAQIEVLVMAMVNEEPVLAAAPSIPEGGTVLEALEEAAFMVAAPIGVKEYPFGKLVVSIAGHTAGPEGDWTYRVNDTLVPLAANAMHLNDGDRVVFRFGGGDPDSLAADSES